MPTRASRKFRHGNQNKNQGMQLQLHHKAHNLSRYSDERQELIAPLIDDVATEKIPPDHSGRPTAEDIDAIMTALNAIIALRHTLQLGMELDKKCPFEPRSIWPRLFAWMKCLYKHCILRHGYDTKTQETAFIEIACLSHLYVHGGDPTKSIYTTPGFTSFVTEIWLKEQHYLTKYTDFKAGYRGFMFSETIAQLLTEEHKREDRVDEIIAAAGTMDSLATYTLKYLRSAISADPLDFHLIRGILFIISMCCVENGRLYGTFLRRSGAFLVAKTFLIAAKHITKPVNHDVLFTVRWAYLFFGTVPLCGKGPYWMIQSLESGLLQGLLLSCGVMKAELPSPHAQIAIETLERVGQALVLHSVLHAVKRPFMEILESGIATPEAAGPLWSHWLTFKDVVAERLHVLSISDTFGLAKANKSCDFPSCINSFDNEELNALRCAGCYNAHYCSRECQRKAWPKHRGFCQSVQDQLEEEVLPPHEIYPEIMFFMLLADQTFSVHKDTILDRIFDFSEQNREKITCFDQLSSYVVCLDFEAYPMAITVGKSLQFQSKRPHRRDEDEFPIDVPSFHPMIASALQKLKGEKVEENNPKLIMQTRAPTIGSWFPDVSNFYVTLHSDFRERFNQKWRARYYGHDLELI